MLAINPPAIVEKAPPFTGFFYYKRDGKHYAGFMNWGVWAWSCRLNAEGNECVHGTEHMENEIFKGPFSKTQHKAHKAQKVAK